MTRIALVVQRYGADIVGGSETLARDIAERLAASGKHVTVFTTCAKDYISWKNEVPAGESLLRGVIVRRFPVLQEREITAFNAYSESFFNTPAEQRKDQDWLRLQGPFCPALVDTLEKEQDDFDLFFFFTYLYYPTVAGMRAIKKPVILFPTAHDEPPLYLPVMTSVFKRPEIVFFLTRSEMDLVERVFQPTGSMELVRTGIDMPPTADVWEVRRRYALYNPYVLYAGRIEKGKGLELVFNSFQAAVQKYPANLILIGKKMMSVPDCRNIRHLGFLSEAEKAALFRGACFSIQPSPLESLSITTLESFQQATPVLANGNCPALLEHLKASGGGLLYHNADEFKLCFSKMLADRDGCRKMGLLGRSYVREFFSWPAVMTRIESACRKLLRENN